MRIRLTTRPAKILDFDLETLAAGFADPNWVPQKVVCAAWSWIGEDDVHSTVCGPMGFFTPELRAKALRPLLEAIHEADVLTGHNLIKFDLPVLNAECMRLGLAPLPAKKVQDTMRFLKTKGFKKGQDNLGGLLKTTERKMALDWQGWEDAYEEGGWPLVRARCESDVRMHKELRAEMITRQWLRPMVWWRP